MIPRTALRALLAGCLIAFVASSTAAAAEKPPKTVAAVLQLEGSNGYSFEVVAASQKASGRGVVYMTAEKGPAAVSYFAAARVSTTELRANFKQLGRISLDLQPSGGVRIARSPCGADDVTYQPGTWEGTIEFNGEEGFSELSETSTPALIKPPLEAACKFGRFDEVVDERGKATRLRVTGPTTGGRLAFQARQSRPGSRVTVAALLTEHRQGVKIIRSVEAYGPAGAMSATKFLGSARVDAPAPFLGAATFRAGAPPAKQWSGNLTVDFPGRAGVPLAGSKLRATLVHTSLVRR